ncbi:MAG: amino acid adenylation domain-containing protein [Isosphaeraceae bacterium]|nr:amino acid adenylation domain-containing protein [Isosphaeraceae bacterium]
MSLPVERRHLSRILACAAEAHPDDLAVEDEAGQGIVYRELARRADRVTTRLARWGVGRGDRVGIAMPKSIETVIAVHGVLGSGAAYVPIDPFAPALRSAEILARAEIKAIIGSSEQIENIRGQWRSESGMPRGIVVGSEVDFEVGASWDEVLADEAPSPLPVAFDSSDPAYILFTSGSTGVPKGVVLTHENAFTFLDWCASTFDARSSDRFVSHAPFHFDLSVFDLYASAQAGGALILVGESLGKDPARLGSFIDDRGITIWYSAPSILSLMTKLGGIDREGYRAPRLVLFAGEVFPIESLRALRSAWPRAAMWNLYGPTETNVCTAFRIPDAIDPDRDAPFPIGTVCAPLRGRVVDEAGIDAARGEIGELVISGPGVMKGYWGRPDLTDAAFFSDPGGSKWYRTGDLVHEEVDGDYVFHGRRDRMIKRRGYRIELGEIEAALDAHDDVERSAVIACEDPSEGMVLTAFVAVDASAKRSVIALKRHCTTRVPGYMIPDIIHFVSALPMTSTAKVDYQSLRELARERRESSGRAEPG